MFRVWLKTRISADSDLFLAGLELRFVLVRDLVQRRNDAWSVRERHLSQSSFVQLLHKTVVVLEGPELAELSLLLPEVFLELGLVQDILVMDDGLVVAALLVASRDLARYSLHAFLSRGEQSRNTVFQNWSN